MLTLQFGRVLQKAKQTKLGEKYIDDFFINNETMKVADAAIDE